MARAQERSTAPQRREFVSPHMGTLWRLVFFHDDAEHAKTARDAAWARLSEIEARLSDYQETSELSRLSRERKIMAPSDDLRRVLTLSRKVSEETEGAFDITVGRPVRLWRAAKKSKTLPAADELAAAVQSVDWRAVRAFDDRVELADTGALLDLGGIAKGWACDEVLTLLRERFGIGSAMIDAGGGLSVSGPPPGEAAWEAALARVSEGDDSASVAAVNCSVDTSGDANQFVEIDGRRYSHVVDPRTGLGLTTRVQATAICPTGGEADALATAFCVMGEERVREFLKKRPDVRAKVTTLRDDGTLRTWSSRGFGKVSAPR